MIQTEVKYLDDPIKWPILASKLRAAGEFGYDSETYGQGEDLSPQHRAKIHCWSVGILTSVRSARGFRHAVGFVLPVAAFDCIEIREVFADYNIRKWAHNAPHDYHSTRNIGVDINGLQDSLQWFRVAFPGRFNYGLKTIATRELGYPERPKFDELMEYEDTEIHAKRTIEKGCICGVRPCRQRSNKEFLDNDGVYRYHTRVSWRHIHPFPKIVSKRYNVTDFVPGAILKPLLWRGTEIDRLKAWWEYSGSDAIQGIEGVDWLRGHCDKQEIKYPW